MLWLLVYYVILCYNEHLIVGSDNGISKKQGMTVRQEAIVLKLTGQYWLMMSVGPQDILNTEDPQLQVDGKSC